MNQGYRLCDRASKWVYLWTMDNSGIIRSESRHFVGSGRQQSRIRYGECSGYHRGLRAGHVFKGVDRELVRSECFLVYHQIRSTGVGQLMRRSPGAGKGKLQPDWRAKAKEQNKVLGADSEERTNPGRIFGSLSGT